MEIRSNKEWNCYETRDESWKRNGKDITLDGQLLKPVIQGEWVKHTVTISHGKCTPCKEDDDEATVFYTCSVCGRELHLGYLEDEEDLKNYPFCHCGACMKEEKKSEEERSCEKCKHECFCDRYLPGGNPCECCSNGEHFESKEEKDTE